MRELCRQDAGQELATTAAGGWTRPGHAPPKVAVAPALTDDQIDQAIDRTR
jgi:hypothetical protein